MRGSRLKHKLWIFLLAIAVVAAAGDAYYHSYRIDEGRKAFHRLGCPVCHGHGDAPSLAHVGRNHDRRFFVDWLTDPVAVYRRLGRMPLNPGYPPMPRQAASPDDIQLLSYYLAAQR